MIFLADFSVIKPDFGLLLWSTVFFLLFWFIVGKMAFRPIKDALKNREISIKNALESAEEAKREVAAMKAENQQLQKKAQEERSLILKEARETADRMINEAKNKAKSEATHIIENAGREIESQKQAAIRDIRNEVGSMAVRISEKILKDELSTENRSTEHINRLVEDMSKN